jgi:hypothetical protein
MCFASYLTKCSTKVSVYNSIDLSLFSHLKNSKYKVELFSDVFELILLAKLYQQFYLSLRSLCLALFKPY